MKKITVLFTVLLMLAASSAFAAITASFPAYYNGSETGTGHKFNGTYLHYTGFALNGSLGTSSYFSVIQSNRTSARLDRAVLINGTSKTLNGTYYYQNGSIQTAGGFENGTNVPALDFDDQFGAVTSLTSMGVTNSSLNATTYFVPAGNYQLMVGWANGSVNATQGEAMNSASPNGRRNLADKAMSMPIVYVNGTFVGVESTDDTWDYYAYGVDPELNNIIVVGQVQITAATGSNNARAKYYVTNGTDVDNTSDWIYYNATGITATHNCLTLDNQDSSYRTLLDNATINADQNMITGFVNSGVGASSNGRVFVVMIKNGTTLSSSDLTNRAFNMIYMGSGYSDKYKGNSTASIQKFTYGSDLTIATGNAEVVTQTATASNRQHMTTADLADYTSALADTSQFGITQSNMTTTTSTGDIAGSFIGKQSADKVFSVGFYIDTEASGSGDNYVGLAFLIPASAVTSDVRAAGSGYQSNNTMATTATNNFANNATGYTQVGLKARWTSIASDFTPLTDVKGYSTTFPSTTKGDRYYTAQFQFKGIGGAISNLRLYKLASDSTSAWDLGYSDAASATTDGAWWISTNTGGGYLNRESILDPDVEYYCNWVIKDGGTYDANSTQAGSIVDPVVLGSVPSSSSSSGCVFNPAAGFGLEWLLLMLAPMVAIVRSRFK